MGVDMEKVRLWVRFRAEVPPGDGGDDASFVGWIELGRWR